MIHTRTTTCNRNNLSPIMFCLPCPFVLFYSLRDILPNCLLERVSLSCHPPCLLRLRLFLPLSSPLAISHSFNILLVCAISCVFLTIAFFMPGHGSRRCCSPLHPRFLFRYFLFFLPTPIST